MDQERTVKEVWKSEPDGGRRMGRPRLRWLEYVEKFVRDLTVKTWRHQEAGGEEWASWGTGGCQRAIELFK